MQQLLQNATFIINCDSTTFFLGNQEKYSYVHFTLDESRKLIRKFDLNRARGQDMITIRMLKICDKAICKLKKFI